MRSFTPRPRALAVLLAGTALAFSPLGGSATAKLPVDHPAAVPDCVTPSGASAKVVAAPTPATSPPPSRRRSRPGPHNC